MENGNILLEGIDTLQIINEDLLELDGYTKRCIELGITEERLEKEVSEKEKAIAEEITLTTKKRRSEVEASFVEQIDKTRVRIKKVQLKKDRFKNAKISERINMETAGNREAISDWKTDIRSVFKKERIPRFFNNRLYYALFMPRSPKDFLICLGGLLLTLLALPIGTFLLLPLQKPLYLVMIYAVCVVFFGSAYIMINNITRSKYLQGLRKARELRSLMDGSYRKIRLIEKTVIRDKDESVYDLEHFNDELKELEMEEEAIDRKKKEALLTYDENTRQVLAEEIRGRYLAELTGLQDNYSQASEDLKNMENKAKEKAIEVANIYEPFIGKEYVCLECIDALLSIMESKEVLTIADAIASYKQDT